MSPNKRRTRRSAATFWICFRIVPWLVLLVVGLFQILAGWTRGSATAYYFYYYVGGGGTEFGTFLVAGTVASITGMFFTAPLVRIFGKKLLMILIMLANGLCMAGFFLLSQDQIAAMYCLHVLGAFLSGPMPILLFAMYADVADYSEWLNHRRATGLVFAAATFSQKLGSSLGAAVPGWALAAFDFQPPIDNVQQPQTQQTIDGIITLMSLIPALFFACGCIAMLFYNISEKLTHQIEFELKERKSKSS